MPSAPRWLLTFARPRKPASPLKAWQWRGLATTVKETPRPIVRDEVIRLREYQEECIQSVLSYLKGGHKRLGISLATGSGKTVIFTQLIDRVQPLSNHANQTLIIAHRRELVLQAASHCERAYPDKTIEIEMGKTRATGVADITIASVQSITSKDRLEKYDPARFKLVLVDEAHHVVASSYMQTLEHFGLDIPRETGPALVGVSATLSRFDGLRLGAAIDHIVYHKDYVDMIEEKWLSDVMFTTVKSGVNLSHVKSNSEGDFHTGQLSAVVNTDEKNEIILKAWLTEAGDRKSTLIFCVDINHVLSLTSMFRQYGIDAQFITGAVRKGVRDERLNSFKNREFPVLINCGVFTEGTDMPNIDCIVLARPTRSRNLLVQMIGRGMRLYPGKENCHVIDMVASLEAGIVTAPTLFGLDPSEVVKGATSEDMKRLREGAISNPTAETASLATQQSEPQDRDLTFVHYESVHDLIEDTSGERHIRAISQNAWVQIFEHKYILSGDGGANILDRKEPDLINVIYKFSLPQGSSSKSPWSRPRVIATATTLFDAIHAADTFAATKFARHFINVNADWRKKPASEGQLTFLNKIRGDLDPLRPDQVTKGRATDMITKIMWGAKGRYDEIVMRRKQEERKVEEMKKRVEISQRESVTVGPLN